LFDGVLRNLHADAQAVLVVEPPGAEGTGEQQLIAAAHEHWLLARAQRPSVAVTVLRLLAPKGDAAGE